MAATTPAGSAAARELPLVPSDMNLTSGSGSAFERNVLDVQRALHKGNTMEELEENVPVEMLWVTLQRARKHKYFFKLVTWTVFVVIFTVVMMMLRPVRATFTVQDSILEQTARAPFPQISWSKTFYDISSDADWWEWVESVLLPNTLNEKYFNGDPRSTAWGSRFANTVAMYNTQTAPIRLRQARVKDDSCDTFSGSSELSSPCWGDFTFARQFKDAFGENYGNRYLTGLNAIGGKDGFGADYGNEAHVVDMPLDEAKAMAIIADMKKGLWLNEQTRAVSIETNWYNANLDLSTYLMLHIDISPGGRFQPYVVIHSCRLWPYSLASDYMRAGLEAVFAAMVVCFCGGWVWDLRRTVDKQAYLTSLWNLLELLNLLSLVFVMIWWLVYVAKDKKPFEVMSSAIHENRPDLSELAAHYSVSSTFAAFSLVYTYVKLFKCAQVFPSLEILWRALELSAVDILTFLFIFLLFTCGFTFAGHWIFGYTMIEFHNWGQSFTTLFQSLMGGLPYKVMSQDSPVSAALFTVAWVLMMCMIFASVFVAIITQWYLQVHEEDLTEKRKLAEKVGPHAGDGFFTIAYRRFQEMFTHDLNSEEAQFDHAANDVQRCLRSADFANDAFIRKAVATGSQVTVADLSGNFRGDDQLTFDFVTKVRDLAAMELSFKENSVVHKFGDKEDEEGEEQVRLQRLQATVSRLEMDLKQLRGALHDSYIARAAAGQSLDGYQVNNSQKRLSGYVELPGVVQDS